MNFFVHIILVLCLLFTILIPGLGCTEIQKTVPQIPKTDKQPTVNSSPSPDQNKLQQQTTKKLGTVEVRITDAPPQKDKEVTSIEITISSVSVHRAQADQVQEQSSSDNSTQKKNQEKQRGQQGSDQWLTLDIVKNKTFDLFKLKGVEDVLAIGQLEEGKYTQIRLVIESAKATYSDNSTADAAVSSGELKFVQSFNIQQNSITTLLLDFDADKSFTVTGSGKVMVKPVVKLSIKPVE